MKNCSNCAKNSVLHCVNSISCTNFSSWKPNYQVLEQALKLAAEEIALARGFTGECVMDDIIAYVIDSY